MISFWKKETGNALNHKKGLTEEQVEFFKQLKVGDRLILWKKRPENGPTFPDYVLKVFAAKEIKEPKI